MPINWSAANERYFMYGLDRGVLYVPGKNPVPWNGLTGFDEGGDPGETSIYYRDGQIFLAETDASDFKGRINALFYPIEFAECVGIAQPTPGMFVDNQKPKQFSLSYRTLVGSGHAGDMFGYQIHLVYNGVPTQDVVSRKTVNSQIELTEFGFDIVCTPVQLTGYRPSAHYIFDTRFMKASEITAVENLLYGVGSVQGRMPTPTELFNLMVSL